jgi:uncharacterized YigZ family protein
MNFKTVGESAEGFYKEKGSKFYAFTSSVKSVEEVKANLEELKKRFYDARHHCYAYILGMKEQKIRANDDGEPNHSAGDPILGQIRSFGFTDTLVVVVRYFGGTKLGVGGLVHAYKTAAAAALTQAGERIIFPTINFQLTFPYESTATVEKALGDYNVDVVDRDYTSFCELNGVIREEWFDQFVSRFELLNEIVVKEVN